ncbi:patched domain-containing protein 3-like [Haliotis rubra]|uniref:patched domain-containing protein 3-like n=1 Tax=Haliotis rubra TaxID=36100 RepID=UPI001EE5773F|nr:patched domain-containing protein 3-like [Haliotis rubra]XP_046556188.1 patched domain-containing protein 3-like [Haliotis rubra]
MGSFSKCFEAVSDFFQRIFGAIGVFIGTYPVILIIISLLVTIVLSCGMVTLSSESDTETLYTPTNSRASQDRVQYQATFPDATGSNYRGYALSDLSMFGRLVVSSATGGNILSNVSLEEIRNHIRIIKHFNITYNGVVFKYDDICARQNGSCFASGEFLVTDAVYQAYLTGGITYPNWDNIDLSAILGQVDSTGGKLVSAKYLSITFNLRMDSADNKAKARAWEEEFLKRAAALDTTSTRINYAASHSLDTELNKNTNGDIVFFSITFTLMITYATVVVGGDVVSSRTWASWAGVMAAGFGIISSFGLVSFCGVKFVNIVGVTPFLIIGIGVDDMFLLMSSWAETYPLRDQTVASRMGKTFASAGIGITITSLTDLLAFVIGVSSVFLSVRNFCLYTGVAVIFCYLYQCVFFSPCLALHGRRVDSNRHCMTCLKTKSREDLRKDDGTSTCKVFCCGGSPPAKRGQDERYFETLPRKYLPRMLLNMWGKIIVILIYIAYLSVSIWGTVNFKQGLILKNLVSTDSYYHSYSETYDMHFSSSFPIPFIFGPTTNYTDKNTVDHIESLIDTAKADSGVDENSLICWYYSYRATTAYDNSSNIAFVSGLKAFLTTTTVFDNDVVFDSSDTAVKDSRCYFLSTNIKESNAQADVMVRMRALADNSPLSVYTFHPAYIFFEQYVAILLSTLQTVGVALVVMTVVTCIFLPHPFLVFLVVINIVSILVGIFGFLHVWGLSLSSVTMIHLIMSVGFSVDFSVHVCSAYMLGEGRNRREKVESAIAHAAGPILNGGMSSFLGILVLVFSKSYIFNSFFKIMFTVILFGMLHAVFLLPLILSILGPVTTSAVRPQSKPTDPAPSISSKMQNGMESRRSIACIHEETEQ